MKQEQVDKAAKMQAQVMASPLVKAGTGLVSLASSRVGMRTKSGRVKKGDASTDLMSSSPVMPSDSSLAMEEGLSADASILSEHELKAAAAAGAAATAAAIANSGKISAPNGAVTYSTLTTTTIIGEQTFATTAVCNATTGQRVCSSSTGLGGGEPSMSRLEHIRMTKQQSSAMLAAYEAAGTRAVKLVKTPLGFGMEFGPHGTVLSVRPDSQAARAGIQKGSRLFSVNDKPISATEELKVLLTNVMIGASVVVGVGGEPSPPPSPPEARQSDPAAPEPTCVVPRSC